MLSGVLVLAIVCVLALTCVVALFQPRLALAATYADGVYEADISAIQASSNSESMLDKALSNPATVTVKGGAATLEFSIAPIDVGGSLGYLGRIQHFPSWTGSGKPAVKDAQDAQVLSTYSVVDDYNSSSSADELMKGKRYPKKVSLSWSLSSDTHYIRVYVPVMAAINAASGWQFARLRVDYSAMRKVGEVESAEESDSGDDSSSGDSQQDSQTDNTTSGDAVESSQTEGESSSSSNPGESKPSTDAGESSSSSSSSNSGKSGASQDSNASDQSGKSGKSSKSSKSDASGKSGKSSSSSTSARSADSTDSDDSNASSGKNSSSTSSAQKLKFKKLDDGTYTVKATAVKSDKSALSMADGALNHVVTVTVKGGSYSLEVGFSGMAVGGKLTYLKSLKYYKSGYKTSSDGSPKGTAVNCKVLSYQMSGGSKLSDSYGTGYPAKVTFPLIEEAKSDGFVPLLVFVPAMEAIASGTGTQSVYLKLDRSSVAAQGGSGNGTGESASQSGDGLGSKSSTGTKSSSTSDAGAHSGSDSNSNAQASSGTNSNSSSGASADAGSGAKRGASMLSTNTLPGSSGSTLPTSQGAGSVAASSEGEASSSAPGSTPQLVRDATEAQPQVDQDAGSVAGSTQRVSSVTPVAAAQPEKEPPLKGAVIPVAIACLAVVLIGVGVSAFRYRSWTVD